MSGTWSEQQRLRLEPGQEAPAQPLSLPSPLASGTEGEEKEAPSNLAEGWAMASGLVCPPV